MDRVLPKTLMNLQFVKAHIMSVCMADDSPEAATRKIKSVEEVEKLPLRYLGTDVVLKNYSIEEMAAQCFLTPITFKRRFVEEYGEPPHRWLTRQRLGHASRLLKFTTLSIKEICYRCDFSSPSNFSRSFKHAYHCTPEEYRSMDHNKTPVGCLEVNAIIKRDDDEIPTDMKTLSSCLEYIYLNTYSLKPKATPEGGR